MKNLFSPREIINSGLCIGCGVCVAQSRDESAVIRFDSFGNLKPFASDKWMAQISERFSRTCPFSPAGRSENYLASVNFPEAQGNHPSIGLYRSNFIGWVIEKNFRANGSSGGMVTWMATELLKNRLVDGVAHVVPADDPCSEGKFFKYRISRTEDQIREGAKSRYYPVELSGVIREIRHSPGHYAIIAVPCMVKAVQLLRQEDPVFNERIRFTLGLFCGHMKSSRFIESFAWQMKVPFRDIRLADFRFKYAGRPANWYNTMLKSKDGKTYHRDWWHLVDGDWGAGFFMNSACNFCDDVVAETADISFGDAWIEPYSSDGRGTNVIIVRSKLVENLIYDAIVQGRVWLTPVSADVVEKTQAAGLRHRREGLSFRLAKLSPPLAPRKRVLPGSAEIRKERKLIYMTRYGISWWSHHVFNVSKRLGMPYLYIFWARIIASVYHGIAYHQGSLREMFKRWSALRL